jgi:hypothetical protein
MQSRSSDVLHARVDRVAVPATLDGIAVGVQVCETGMIE